MKLIIAAVALAWVVARPMFTPDACQLLSAQDASQLAGFAVSRAEHSGGINCRYNKPGGPMSFDGVEITVRQEGSSEAAHARFPRWVVPVPPLPKDMTVTPVTGVGDEATITHTPAAVGISGIYFRRGSVLVKIGVHPPPSDAAMTAAGKIAVSRL